MLLPAPHLRINVGTWLVPPASAPAVARRMLLGMNPEPFDPDFNGQALETTYFDTPSFALRKARRHKEKYLTLRIRRYSACGFAHTPPAYALSAKTESGKFRTELTHAHAEAALTKPSALHALLQTALPPDYLARLLAIVGEAMLMPVVTVCATRYAVENETDRLTLDLSITTDMGKTLSAGVLEHKTTSRIGPTIGWPDALGLRPIKMSKFLWASEA